MTMGKGVLTAVVLCTLFLSSVAADFSGVGYYPTDLESEESLGNLYQSWVLKHGKEYNSLDEMDLRFQIFKNNLRFIDEHNKNAIGNDNYWLGLNSFADLTHEEFKSKYVGSKLVRKHAKAPRTSFRYRHARAAPNVDWRETGAITNVKDQGSCG